MLAVSKARARAMIDGQHATSSRRSATRCSTATS